MTKVIRERRGIRNSLLSVLEKDLAIPVTRLLRSRCVDCGAVTKHGNSAYMPNAHNEFIFLIFGHEASTPIWFVRGFIWLIFKFDCDYPKTPEGKATSAQNGNWPRPMARLMKLTPTEFLRILKRAF